MLLLNSERSSTDSRLRAGLLCRCCSRYCASLAKSAFCRGVHHLRHRTPRWASFVPRERNTWKNVFLSTFFQENVHIHNVQLNVARSFAVAAAVGTSLVAPCIVVEPLGRAQVIFGTKKRILKTLSTIDACSTIRTMCYTKGDTTVRCARYDNSGDVTYGTSLIECNIHSNTHINIVSCAVG